MPYKEIVIKKIFFLIFSFFMLWGTACLAQNKPYLILVSCDGFRWDYANRGLTPNLDSIKRNGCSALSLRSSYPSVTFPNHLSIITGMYPQNHGIISNDFINPFSKERYTISDTNAVRNAKWYLGEPFWETAERQGIKTASYFWPGSEMSLSYRHPSYYEKYEHTRNYKKRVEGVIDWLQLPYKDRPHFITLYFDETDSKGHAYGTNSPQVNSAIMHLDSVIGFLFLKLKSTRFADSINVIVLSDHGMTDVSNDRMINIEEIVGKGNELYDNGPLMMINPGKNNEEEIYKKLKDKENHYKVYKKEEMPEYYHFSSNPFIPSIIVIADLGWSLVDNAALNKSKKKSLAANHGYDNNTTDMQGIFYATGPAFKSNYRTGTLWNIDIYPLLCRIFNIYPRQNIDGKLERIEFILK